jgi:transposase
VTREDAIALYESGMDSTVAALVAQGERIGELERDLEKLLSASRGKSRRFCPECLDKQRKNDRLQTENQSLKDKLNYRKKKSQEGYFGSSTPSSKKPVKANTERKKRKKSGAKAGHKGHGRKGFTPEEADRVISVSVADELCVCGGTLHTRGSKSRSVLDLPLIRPEKVLHLFERKQCLSCDNLLYGRVGGVLPRRLYGNGLIAQTAVWHYVHGIPMGTIEEMLGLPRCSLIDVFHDVAKLFGPVLPRLMKEFRHALVKHADETPWRTEGQSGYAWVFYCDTVSLFLFRHTRSGEVPREVLGTEPVPGVLGVDRYSGYSRVPCKVQYCYEHLKRNLQDIVKQFPDEPEVKRFGHDVVAMLRKAMKLRRRRISDKRFYEQAAELKRKIKAAMEADANHEAIRTYQEIFREKEDKMYHWADDRRVPADNNRAEKELRPIVIARKISFGSQSPKGRKTREILASVLNTLRQRGCNPAVALKAALDRLAAEPDLERYPLLFGESVPIERTKTSTQPRRSTPPAKDSVVHKPDSLPPFAPPRAPNLTAVSQHVLVAVILLVTLLAAVGLVNPPAGPVDPFSRRSSPPIAQAATSPSPSPSPSSFSSSFSPPVSNYVEGPPSTANRQSRGPPGHSAQTVTAEHGGDPSSPLRSPQDDTNAVRPNSTQE